MSAEEISCKIPVFESADPRVTVGRFTYGNPNINIWTANDKVDIGAFCSIANNVTIFGGGEHNLRWTTTYPLRIAFGHPLAHQDGHPRTKGKTVIGNDVWIGNGAMILSGVRVGDGAVIGARAVVASDVPPYAIVVGNPARLIRYRFAPETIEKLLKMAWWHWPLEKIRANIDALSSDPAEALFSEKE